MVRLVVEQASVKAASVKEELGKMKQPRGSQTISKSVSP